MAARQEGATTTATRMEQVVVFLRKEQGATNGEVQQQPDNHKVNARRRGDELPRSKQSGKRYQSRHD
jgi:hypothetical protein